jgi:hypothetical protein
MTGEQRAVLWIGLLLITLNLVMKWSEIRSVIFSGPSSTSPGQSSGGSGGGKGGLQIPDPLHQFPGGTFLPPTITVPV